MPSVDVLARAPQQPQTQSTHTTSPNYLITYVSISIAIFTALALVSMGFLYLKKEFQLFTERIEKAIQKLEYATIITEAKASKQTQPQHYHQIHTPQ